MPFHEIRILDSNPTTGILTLSDGGMTEVKRSDPIAWVIDDRKVISIRIEKKKGSSNIFAVPPPPTYGTSVRLQVSQSAPYINYEYSIFWKTKGSSVEYEYDPKIAVMPVPFDKKKLTIVSLLIVAVVSIFLFSKKTRCFS